MAKSRTMYDRNQRDWENIRHLTLPHIDAPEKYRQVTTAHIRQAERWLEKRQPIAVPSQDDIRSVHKIAFRGVYGFAGDFRGREHHAGAGHDPGSSAFYQRIPYELDRLADHVRPMIGHRASEHQRAHSIALYHLQFECIHPFREGNGRTGRLLAAAQTVSLLRVEPEPTTDRDGYLAALRHAEKEKDLGPLCKALTGVDLPGRLRSTDYDLALWPAPVEKVTARGNRFFVAADDIDIAEDIDDAVLTKRLEQAIDDNPGKPAPPMDMNFSRRPIVLDLDRPRERERDFEPG